MLRTPSSVACAIESTAPITTTNRIARSFSPNHRIASGSQQMLGRVCRPITNRPRVSFTQRNCAMSSPMLSPAAIARA